MNRMMLLLVAGVALCLSPRHCADAGCHAVAIKKQAVVAYTPVVAPYYWSVGANLQAQASEERIANLVIQKLQAQQQTAPERLPLTAEADRWALVKANCQGCHITDKEAIAAVDMSILDDLNCSTKLKMAAAVLDSKMPPKKQLDPTIIGNLLGEIVGAETVEH